MFVSHARRFREFFYAATFDRNSIPKLELNARAHVHTEFEWAGALLLPR